MSAPANLSIRLSGDIRHDLTTLNAPGLLHVGLTLYKHQAGARPVAHVALTNINKAALAIQLIRAQYPWRLKSAMHSL
jgi:hypothetical protein